MREKTTDLHDMLTVAALV